MALDPSNFLSTIPGAATPGQQAQAQQLSDLATPQQIQSMYDYAKALRTSSQETPVKAWTQGVSNVVKALMGGVEENRAGNAERSRFGAQANAIPGDDSSRPGELPGFGSIDTNRPQRTGGDAPSDPAMAYSESGGNDSAKNPNSSATGRYQFTDGTWDDVMKRHPDLGLTADGRTDPAQQEKAKAAYTSDNDKVLSTAGYDPSPANERLAMRFGATGATKVLGADPNASMASVMSPNVMSVNPGLANATAGSTVQRYASLGAPNLPPDAQATVKALNPNAQVAQNGAPQPGGMLQPGFDPQQMINQMARRLIMTGIPPQQALATATEYVSNNLKLAPQYSVDPYGREMMTQPGHPPQLTGRQMGPGQKGEFMGLPTTTTVGPNQQEHIRIQTPETGPPAPPPGSQGAVQAPGNVGQAQPAGAPTAPVAASASPPAPSPAAPPITLAGPAPQGTQVPPQPESAPQAPPSGSTMPPMPSGSHVTVQDWQQWQADVAATKAAAVKSAEALAEAAAKGRVKPIDEAVEIGTKAGPIMNDLDTLRDAYAAAGDNINGGPFAGKIIQAKQAINEFLPGTNLVDQDKLNASQIIQKINMGLATKMVKELTSRGTQMEIMLAMKNNPGVMMSDKGSLYMIDLLKQMQTQNQQLGILASQKGYDNPREWNAMQRSYYDTHPLISPFTGKPLNSQTALNSDMASLPALSTPTAQQGAPGFNVPSPAAPPEVKTPEDLDAWIGKMQLKPGSPFTLPDGRPAFAH